MTRTISAPFPVPSSFPVCPSFQFPVPARGYGGLAQPARAEWLKEVAPHELPPSVEGLFATHFEGSTEKREEAAGAQDSSPRTDLYV